MSLDTHVGWYQFLHQSPSGIKPFICMLTIEDHYFKDLPLLQTHPKLVFKKLDLNKVYFFCKTLLLHFVNKFYFFIEIQPLQRTRGQPYNRWCEFITTYDKYWFVQLPHFYEKANVVIFPHYAPIVPSPSQGNNA